MSQQLQGYRCHLRKIRNYPCIRVTYKQVSHYSTKLDARLLGYSPTMFIGKVKNLQHWSRWCKRPFANLKQRRNLIGSHSSVQLRCMTTSSLRGCISRNFSVSRKN